MHQSNPDADLDPESWAQPLEFQMFASYYTSFRLIPFFRLPYFFQSIDCARCAYEVTLVTSFSNLYISMCVRKPNFS